MKMAVETESAVGLAHAFAMPAVLLNRQRGVEAAGSVTGRAPRKARIEKAAHAGAVVRVIHRGDEGFGAKHRAQSAGELPELRR